MRPGEQLWEAILMAQAIAASSGANEYQVVDSKGIPIPRRSLNGIPESCDIDLSRCEYLGFKR